MSLMPARTSLSDSSCRGSLLTVPGYPTWHNASLSTTAGISQSNPLQSESALSLTWQKIQLRRIWPGCLLWNTAAATFSAVTPHNTFHCCDRRLVILQNYISKVARSSMGGAEPGIWTWAVLLMTLPHTRPVGRTPHGWGFFYRLPLICWKMCTYCNLCLW